ncbi:peptidyl-prolyl cis-trans isomerase, partial [bacterium]|nr:peptidyl-prolyl cis-trans isomerase [bacterium]
TAKDGGSLGIIPKSLTLPGFDQERLEEFEGEVTRFGSSVDPEFSWAAFSLKEGETGEPVKSSLGYHIIRVQEKILPDIDKLDEIRKEVSARLLREEENRLFVEFYKSLKEKAKIKINDLSLPRGNAFAQQSPDEAAAAACATCGGCGGGLLLIIVAIFIINIAILVWVARDSKNRGMGSAVGWLLLIFFMGPIGLIIYFFSRPQGEVEVCSHCNNKRLKAMAKCPHCGN